jgi:hypothetical protein
MKDQSSSLHPIAKISAHLGALLCAFFGLTQMISAFASWPDAMAVLLEFAKGALIIYLAWCFWFAAKFNINPFTQRPFSIKNTTSKRHPIV